MKTKILTLLLLGILTFGISSCSDEEVTPSNSAQFNQKSTSTGILVTDSDRR